MAYLRDGRPFILLVVVVMVFQIYPGLKVTTAEEDVEHTYIIFEDDFKDGEAEDWSLNIPDEAPLGSSWAVELDDGNHVLRVKGQTWADAGDYLWTNYTFEVKIKMLSPQGGGHISFRMGGPSRYFVQFWSNDIFFTKEYMGTYNEVVHTSVLFNLNTWYDFKIVCVGNSMWVYVDDVLKLDYVDEDDPILSGRIGLEGSPDSHILFDDVKVSTTHRLYVSHLIKEAQDEISKAQMIDADTSEAEWRLAEAQAAFAEGDLALAESLARKTFNLANHAPVGPVSVNELSKYSAEYDQRTVEVSGTIKDIEYVQGIYKIAVEDGTGVISATFNGTLGDIKTEDKVKIIGIYDASTEMVVAETLERVKPPMEGLYTFLVFKDDFEDGDFGGWMIDVDPETEGSMWKVVKEGDNYVLSCEGGSWGWTGDPEWTDFTFELKIKVVKGLAGINFRVTPRLETPELYGLGLSRYDLTLVKIELYMKEAREAHLKHTNVDLDPDAWYTIKIVCLENNIKAYLDDELKLDYTDEDNPFLSGFIELNSLPYDGSKPSHILFDDVKVSKIATTSDIADLITYAQSEIDEAREINADVSAAELKLEQANQALVREDYQIVQYMVDEAVWLAKSASLGQISIKDLRAMATRYSGHTVIIIGTVKDLQARYGAGYDFNINDGTGGLAVTYQGALVDIEDKYEVRVTGIFDAPSETVTASKMEKISGPQTPLPGATTGLTWSIELATWLITISAAGVGFAGWMARTRSTRRRKKILFKKLMEEIDDVYSRFKMNSRQCEGELQRLKNEVLDEFKEDTIDENNYNILNKRIDNYMKEFKEQIEKEKPR